MGNRFDAIFGGLLPDTLPEGAAEGKVLSIEVEREKQTVEITAAFDRVIVRRRWRNWDGPWRKNCR